MNKLRELIQKRNELATEIRSLVDEDKLEEAETKRNELRTIKQKIETLEEIESIEDVGNQLNTDPTTDTRSDEQKYHDAFFKYVRGAKVNAEERSLLQENRSMLGSADSKGGYLIPEDFKAKILEFRRQYKSIVPYVSKLQTKVRSGQIPAEDISGGITTLFNLTEGENIPETDAMFKQINFSISDMGAIIPVSNTLISDDATGGLMDYLARYFTRKLILTENKTIFDLMRTKVATPLADYSALAKSLNVDLDPSLEPSTIIVTNQDGFNYLDEQVATDGRPILQPDLKNPTEKRFKGRQIVVFSNSLLPNHNDGTYDHAPFFYGSLQDGLAFVDRNQTTLRTSSEAGFENNTTKIRMITRFGAVELDSSAYYHGQIQLT